MLTIRVYRLSPRSGGGAVSPLHPDRIALVHSGGTLDVAIVYRNLETGDWDVLPRVWGSLWTHPETGEVYYHAAVTDPEKSVGWVDFVQGELIHVAGGAADSFAYIGFASDDPRHLYYVLTYPGFRPYTVDVYDTRQSAGPRNPTTSWILSEDRTEIWYAGSVAHDARSDTLYVDVSVRTGSSRVRSHAIVAHSAGATTWFPFDKPIRQLYFLSGHGGLFVQTGGQTDMDLYVFNVSPTGVSPRRSLLAIWADIKTDRQGG